LKIRKFFDQRKLFHTSLAAIVTSGVESRAIAKIGKDTSVETIVMAAKESDGAVFIIVTVTQTWTIFSYSDFSNTYS